MQWQRPAPDPPVDIRCRPSRLTVVPSISPESFSIRYRPFFLKSAARTFFRSHASLDLSIQDKLLRWTSGRFQFATPGLKSHLHPSISGANRWSPHFLELPTSPVIHSLSAVASGAMPSSNRKREREAGQDGARPKKKKSIKKGKKSTSASTSASASKSALTAAPVPESDSTTAVAAPAVPAAENSDPDALVGPYDGHRRYDQWKGIMCKCSRNQFFMVFFLG